MGYGMDGVADGLLSVDRDLDREFEVLLIESSSIAFRVAYSVLRQRQDAEDVAQEALLKAHRRRYQLRDRARFRAWIVRMTWRLALDRQRSDRRRVTRETEHVELGDVRAVTPGAAAEARASDLWTALDALPDKLRMTIVLAGIHGHDVREVAALLGVPEGTVKSRLFLARQRLREMLQW